jgi:hypothetical protein
MSNFIRTVINKIDSGSSVIWVYLVGDEGRAVRELQHLAEVYSEESGIEIRMYEWNSASGASWNSQLTDPLQVLSSVEHTVQSDGLVLLKDFGTLLNGPGPKAMQLRRELAEVCQLNKVSNTKRTRPLVILSTEAVPHSEIADYCDAVDFELPDYDSMYNDAVCFIMRSALGAEGREPTDKDVKQALHAIGDEVVDRITRSLLGLSSEEAQRILAYAMTASGGLNTDCLQIIAGEKARAIRKVDGLRYVPYENIPNIDEIGGFEDLLDWTRKRRRAYTRHAEALKIEKPRGAVLIGPAGTGKTVVAKATAKMLGLDLLLMDIGAMFDKYVGGSEGKIRAAMQMVSRMPNVLLMVDEIDKVFGGAHEGQAADSGIASRVLSYFLSWLSERDMSATATNRCFVMVTMNRTTGLPTELLRAGRFDRIWSTDLPDQDERLAILQIHLRKRYVDPATYGKSLARVAKATPDYTGAELEEGVISACNDAYDARMSAWESQNDADAPMPTSEDIRPTIDELLAAMKEITPVAKLHADEISRIRQFCRENTKPVNGRRIHTTKTEREPRKVGGRRITANASQGAQQ